MGRIMLWRYLSVRGNYSFPDYFFFLAIFAAIALNLGLLFCSIKMSYSSSLRFDVIDIIMYYCRRIQFFEGKFVVLWVKQDFMGINFRGV
jgi:hypothetical protein